VSNRGPFCFNQGGEKKKMKQGHTPRESFSQGKEGGGKKAAGTKNQTCLKICEKVANGGKGDLKTRLGWDQLPGRGKTELN